MASRTSKRHRMRCSKRNCHVRFTLKRHPDLYKRTVRCPVCKTDKVYSCEAARRRELAKQGTCHCMNYPFPHRAGSMRLCFKHPDFEQSPTDEEMDSYRRVIETSRSATR